MADSSYSLAAIRDTADRKYGPMVLDDVPGGPVVLVPAIRLDKVKRQAMADLQARINGGPQDDLDPVVDGVTEMIRLACETPEQADRLLAEVGDDLGVLMTLLTAYGERSQLGEASGSVS